MNPYVFIIGCPRSGTTLLQRIVDAHPRLAVINQSQWLPGLAEKVNHWSSEGLVTATKIRKIIEHTRMDEHLAITAEDLEGLLAGGPLPYVRFASAVFDLYGRRRGKDLVGDKTPIYVRKVRILHDLWPEARFVHLIRDGRDVCLSTINWKRKEEKLADLFATWRRDAISTAAMRWCWNVRLGREAGLPLGSKQYYELRYEALVHQPAEECARLCDFLGVPYADVMLRFHEGRTQDDPNLDAKKAWRPITPGLRDWRTQMPPEHQEQFEATAGDLLDELGYPRAVPRPRSEMLRQASQIQESFVQELHARKRAVPERW
jgi:hypothetical protein